MDMAIDWLRHGAGVVFASLHTTNDPSDDEWNASMQLCREIRDKHHLALEQLTSVVITDGGAPKAHHRGVLNRDFPIRTAVMTNALTNPVKRGIATALRWVNPRILFCEPKDALRAFQHVGLAPPFDDLRTIFEKLQTRLPPIEGLDQVGRVVGWR